VTTLGTAPRRQPEAGTGSVALARADIVIGRDVLELISSAMYVDPMSIYREYVQNAADAIDAARAHALDMPGGTGTVAISIDAAARSITIRDNGTGIPSAQFARRMTALGGSAKRGSGARGFRGVGRLAGLGYAQELVFRSRVDGETLASEIRWDCRRLRTKLREAGQDDIVDLIRDIASVRRTTLPDHPDRFFEIELKGVVRLRSDRLMNPAAVAEYLGQVAPVPFSEDFRFGPEIAAALGGAVGLGDLDIRVLGVADPVRRPHRDTFAIDESRTAAFTSLETLELPGIDGGAAAIAWVLHHDYEGALPAATSIKGLRLRSGNIQVGDYALLEELFPETRFNAWSVGEVHVVDNRIVPNGRRDHFEQNAHYHNLVNHLTPLARDIAKRCRTGSVRRKWLRDFEVHRQVATEKIAIVAQGSLGQAERQAISLATEQTIMQMERIAGMDLFADSEPETLRAGAALLRQDLATAMSEAVPAASPLARLPAERRAMYEHLFDLVYECSTNRTAAKALIDRILMKIT